MQNTWEEVLFQIDEKSTRSFSLIKITFSCTVVKKRKKCAKILFNAQMNSILPPMSLYSSSVKMFINFDISPLSVDTIYFITVSKLYYCLEVSM